MIKKTLIGVVVTLVALLIICLVPLKEVTYTVTVDYEDTETYQETEPLSYKVIDTDTMVGRYSEFESLPEMKPVWVYPKMCVEIQNTDSVAGLFCVHFNFLGDTGQDVIYLKPREIGKAFYTSTGIVPRYSDWSVWNYKVTGTKTVEKQRTVTKQRPETHYKKVTLLDYLLHY